LAALTARGSKRALLLISGEHIEATRELIAANAERRALIEQIDRLLVPDRERWQRFDKVTPHGTLMSVGLHHGDAKQIYVAARYGEVFGTQDGGDSWLEMPLPQGVQHVYALACA
jgi:hypothetical protein